MQTAEELNTYLMQKAAEDEDFRAQLVSDPKGVLNDQFGITVPDNIQIKVHESDLQTIHLALPPTPVLNEEQLEAISAGWCCCGN